MLKCLAIAAALTAAVAAVGASGPADSLRVELHLRPRRAEAEIEEEFWARSTPGNGRYRRFLNSSQLRDLVGAPSARIARVRAALTGMGAANVVVLAHDDIVTADVPDAAASAFALEAAVGHPAFRMAMAVPRALAGDVTLAIAARGVLKADRTGPAAADGAFPGAPQTPRSVRALYKVPMEPAVAPPTYSQGVAEFQQSYFKMGDIKEFSRYYGLPMPVVNITGPNGQSSDDIEGTLDLEYITAISGGIATWWVSHNAFDFTQWAEQLLTISPPPSVVSISWGQGEFAYYGNESVINSDNTQFRKLGLMGISVLVASGDSGPSSRGYSSCTTFMPGWPASSPYVTTVGATYHSHEKPETSVSFSGGGFSTLNARPSYQDAAVAEYLKNTTALPKFSFFNQSGRGYPDVAALGTNFMIYAPDGSGSRWMPVSGTSCASPTFAAIISRINAERMIAGKSALGFLNPTLYSLGKVGLDITEGASLFGSCILNPQLPGFPALKGWDAVSGLGTPDYKYLKDNL